MKSIRLMIAGLKNDTRGVTALEYAMIASIIAIAVIAGYGTLGNSLSTALTRVSSSVSTTPTN